jgi:hypothetical protein
MGINFSTSDRWIKGSSATQYQQNGATGRSTTSTQQNIGFYNGDTEHMRFDDYGTVTNVYGSPGTVMRKTEAGATPDQTRIPMTLTAGSLPTYNKRSNTAQKNSLLAFVCPVSGVYRFSLCALQGPNSVVSIKINDVRWWNGSHCVGLGLSYITQATEYMRTLTAGDYIQGESWNGGNVWGDNGWTTLTVNFVA